MSSRAGQAGSLGWLDQELEGQSMIPLLPGQCVTTDKYDEQWVRGVSWVVILHVITQQNIYERAPFQAYHHKDNGTEAKVTQGNRELKQKVVRTVMEVCTRSYASIEKGKGGFLEEETTDPKV